MRGSRGMCVGSGEWTISSIENSTYAHNKIALKKKDLSPPPPPARKNKFIPSPKRNILDPRMLSIFSSRLLKFFSFLLKGVEQVAFGRIGKTTSTILVSEGAECILINRKFFQQYLTDEVAKRIRRTVSYQFVHKYMYNQNFYTVYMLIKEM